MSRNGSVRRSGHARAGDGRLFGELRRRMRESGARGASLTEAIDRAGEAWGEIAVEGRRNRAFFAEWKDPEREGIVALAAPTAAGMAVMSVGGLLFNRLLAGFGEIAVAAYGAASKVDMIVALPIMGLAGAAVSVVGMFAGAGRVDLVRSTALYTYRWAVLLASLIGIAVTTSTPRSEAVSLLESRPSG